MIHRYQFARNLVRLFGWWSAAKLVTAHALKWERVHVYLRAIRRAVVCRPWTGDFAALREVFTHDGLDATGLGKGGVQFIVDLGANVGYATLSLAHSFPDARILAVEPDKENFRVLADNCRAESRLSPLYLAVSHQNGWLAITDDSSNSVSRQFTVPAEPERGVRALTMPDLLGEAGWPRADLVKIDIEGAERDLFLRGDLGWMRDTTAIVIEFHGQDVEDSVRLVLEGQGFRSTGSWGDKAVFTKPAGIFPGAEG